jgi:undecaprenyl-diphosphatase
MILVSRFFHIPETDFLKTFKIVIQLGAICAVLVLYFKKVFKDWELIKRIIVAFIPTAVMGFVLYKFIKSYLIGNVGVVLWALGIVGFLFIAIEYLVGKRSVVEQKPISYMQAFLIGCAQSLAVIPGVSRSGATVMGGLLLGVNRKSIVEFSFLLAVPTMLAAAGYDLLRSGAIVTSDTFMPLLVGFFVAFIVAIIAVRWFIGFIQSNTFVGFGVYRIVVAILGLLVFFA